MRIPFNLKNIFIHTLNALGPPHNNHTSLPPPLNRETATASTIPINLNTRNEKRGLTAPPPLIPPELPPAPHAVLSPLNLGQPLLTTLPSPFFTLSLDQSTLAQQRRALRRNNAVLANENLRNTAVFQQLRAPSLASTRSKRELQIPSSLRHSPLESTRAPAPEFPYLSKALNQYEMLFSVLMRQEQIRTGESARAVEARIGEPMRDFFSKLMEALNLQNYASPLTAPRHVFHDSYQQVFSALPHTHQKNFDKGAFPNVREYLYILYKIKLALESTPPIPPEETATNMLALVAHMRLNSNSVTRDQELAALFGSTEGMRAYYCQQALDLYVGHHALTLDQYFDWEKVRAHINTNAQIFAAVFENLSEREQIEYKTAMDTLGWRITQAFNDRKPLLSPLSTYSEKEKNLFVQAALIYNKIHYPHHNIEGVELFALQNRFAHALRDEYQKNQIFRAPSASSPQAVSAPSQPIFFGNMALENAQGKNFNQLLTEPSLQNILGFKLYPQVKQAALLIERLIEKGESPDARYRVGSFFHSVASVLIRVAQMQGQTFQYNFGSTTDLMRRFIETVNTWNTTRHLPIHPLVLLGLHLAASSHEQIIDANSAWETKMQALSTYIQGRWSAHLDAAPPPFDRRKAALQLLLTHTKHSRHRIENHIQTFSEMINGAVTNEQRMTLLDYFLKRADDNKSFQVKGVRIDPHQLLQAAEEKYNEDLKSVPWIINRAKENLRERGTSLSSPHALNHEINHLAKSYSTQTEEERDTRHLLQVSEQIPLLGMFVSLVDGIASHDKDKIIGSIPLIGQAYNLEEGLRTHDVQRTMSAIPILGTGQAVIQSIRAGDVIGTYMNALGFVIDIETNAPAITHSVQRVIQQTRSTLPAIQAHQLSHHLRANLEHTAAVGEVLGLPLRSIQLPPEVANPLQAPLKKTLRPPTQVDANNAAAITKTGTQPTLKQRLQQFAETNTQFKKNGWAQIVDPQLNRNGDIFVLTRLAQTTELTLLKERLGGRYEMFDLETGQAKNNGIGIYKTLVDDKVEFYRGGLLGGGNIDWKKSYPQLAHALTEWLLQEDPEEERLQVYRCIDEWMNMSNLEKPLKLAGYRLKTLPPLPASARILDISNNRLHTLEGLPVHLEVLHVENNFLTHLPPLPETLMILKAAYNRLTSLPENLPKNLKGLHLASNLLTDLPHLPNTIELIDISGNQIKLLPSALPTQLKLLDASNNQLTSLPTHWPSELSVLKVDGNAITTLETLPKRLKRLDLSRNSALQNWPQNWPSSLTELRMAQCGLTTLRDMPRLPNLLEKLDFSRNQLTALPEQLPPFLRELLFAENEISYLPPLPHHLEELRGGANKLHTWPEQLPATLIEIDLQSNELSGELPNNLPPGLLILNLGKNHLTALPQDLSPTLRWLKVNDNQLRALPALPQNLLELFANDNQLSALPALPHHLIKLVVNNNQLPSLPAQLPISLRHLHAANNQLSSLPISIPLHMQHLNVENNRLTSLPEMPLDISIINLNHNQLTSLPRSLLRRGHRYVIHAEGNRFSAPFIDSINAIPRRYRTLIHFTAPSEYVELSVRQEAEAAAARALEQAIGAWYSAAERTKVEEVWEVWKNEAKASSFSKFIDHLANTKAAKHEEFQVQVRTLLSQASQDSELRAMLFTIAAEGLGSCSDRTALTFNRMATVKIELDAMRGAYDNALRVMIPLARQMFRLDQLSEIAAQKVADSAIVEITGLPLLDDVEVYLEYQIKLRDTLQLNFLPIKKMKYSSGLEDEDFVAAERQVKQAENTQFINYLSAQWQPWQTVLQRLDTAAYNHAKEQISNQSEVFEQALNAYLSEKRLPNTEQMRAQHGPQLANQMRDAVYKTLTEKFLEKQGLSDLLEPIWPQENERASTSTT